MEEKPPRPSNSSDQIDPRELVKNLSVGYQQMIEIAKAIQQNAQVLIMDEPSARHHQRGRGHVQVVELLRKGRFHHLHLTVWRIFRLSDRIEVIRDGEYVTTLITPKATVDELIKLMVGREMTSSRPQACIDQAGGSGSAECHRQRRQNMTMQIHAGEVLGLGVW